MRIPIRRDASIPAEKPTFPDLDSIPEGGLRELKYIVIDGNKIDEKIIYDEKIANFKRLFPTIHQPSFYISYESWQRLILGKYENGDSVFPKFYKVYAFVFCIMYNNNKQNEQISFRIRTILKSTLSHVNLLDSIKNEIMPEFSPFRDKNKPRLYDYEPELEIDNIAYVDWDIAKNNGSDGTEDCLKFIYESEPTASDLNISKNQEVANWRAKISSGVHLKSWNYILKKKKPFDGFNPNPFQNSPKPDFIQPLPNSKEQNITSDQDGVMFSRDQIEKILIQYPKGTKIDFAVDFLEDAPKKIDPLNGDKYYPFKFVFKINPEYVTDGLPCPYPPVCANE